MPATETFLRAVTAAATAAGESSLFEVAVSVTSPERMRELNEQWREKPKPTNVLACANAEIPDLVLPPDAVRHLGDIVICAEVVLKEAEGQAKLAIDHWQHMVVHGMLHLLGFDHIQENEAEEMEQLEREALTCLGVADPYV